MMHLWLPIFEFTIDGVTQKDYMLNTNSSSITIGEAINSWLNAVKRSRSRCTYSGYRSATKSFLPYFSQKMADFSKKDAVNMAETLSEGLNPNTIRAKRVVWHSFFEWAIDIYELDMQNPFKKMKMLPRKKPIERFFWTPDQIEMILDHAPSPEHRIFYAMMAFNGLRFFEAAEFKWEYIRDGWLTFNGKGSVRGRIPLCPRLREEFSRYLGSPAFPSCGSVFSRRFYESHENKILKTICKRLDMKFDGVAHCHRFRHSFASNALRAGANIAVISKLLRHSNINVTCSHYLHISDSDMESTLKLL